MSKRQRTSKKTSMTKQQIMDQAIEILRDSLRRSMKKEFGTSVRVVYDGGWLREKKPRKGGKNG